MAKPSAWSPDMIAHLLRLDAMAASDAKITFRVMADRINEAFGTTFTRNAIAGRIRDLKSGTGYGATRQPRQAGQKPAEPQEAKPQEAKPAPPKPKPYRKPFTPPMVAPKRPKSCTPAPAAAKPPQCQPVTLMERKPSQCGWPVNDGNPFLFCGEAKTGDPVYCAYHREMATSRSWRIPRSAAP